jgi:hypothetical protein
MVLAKAAWLGMHHEPLASLRDPASAAAINNRIVYIGDNLPKDGGLAAASHVDFVHLKAPQQHEAWEELGRYLPLGSRAVDGART